MAQLKFKMSEKWHSALTEWCINRIIDQNVPEGSRRKPPLHKQENLYPVSETGRIMGPVKKPGS